jgi:hypothetical protein
MVAGLISDGVIHLGIERSEEKKVQEVFSVG